MRVPLINANCDAASLSNAVTVKAHPEISTSLLANVVHEIRHPDIVPVYTGRVDDEAKLPPVKSEFVNAAPPVHPCTELPTQSHESTVKLVVPLKMLPLTIALNPEVDGHPPLIETAEPTTVLFENCCSAVADMVELCR